MARRKASFQAQNRHSNSSHDVPTGIKLSAREYYNQRFEKVDKNHRSTSLYADRINFHIDRIEELWRESVTFSVRSVVILLTLSIL